MDDIVDETARIGYQLAGVSTVQTFAQANQLSCARMQTVVVNCAYKSNHIFD
jgi:hypothetical protein